MQFLWAYALISQLEKIAFSFFQELIYLLLPLVPIYGTAGSLVWIARSHPTQWHPKVYIVLSGIRSILFPHQYPKSGKIETSSLGSSLKIQNVGHMFYSSPCLSYHHPPPDPGEELPALSCASCRFLEFSQRYFGPYCVVKSLSLLGSKGWDFLFHHLDDITASTLSYVIFHGI